MLGVYRSAMKSADAVLPYVYTSPLPDTILRGNDKLFLFGNPSVVAAAMEEFRKPFTRDDKGNLGIDSNIAESKIPIFQKSIRGNLQLRSSRIIFEEDKDALESRKNSVVSTDAKNVSMVRKFTMDPDDRDATVAKIQALFRGHNLRKHRLARKRDKRI